MWGILWVHSITKCLLTLTGFGEVLLIKTLPNQKKIGYIAVKISHSRQSGICWE